MPYFRDPNLENDDENQQGILISSAGEQAGGDGSLQGQDSNGKKPTGSNFTNIDSYLNGENAKNFGQEFGGKIQGSINKAKSTIDSTADTVKNQASSYGYVPSRDEINSYISGAGDSTTDEDAKKFQGWTSQAYAGPRGIEDNQNAWNEYWGNLKEAKTVANAADKESGRFALLDKYYGRPSYSFGEKSLDNLLVQTGGGFNNSAELKKQAADLDPYAKKRQEEVSSAATQRAADIENARTAARQAIGLGENGQISGGALGSLTADIEARVAAENQKRAALYSSLLSQLGGGTERVSGKGPTANIKDYVNGIDPNTHIYDMNLANYLKRGPDANKTQVATDQDYARYLALSKLAGVDPSYLSADQRQNAGKLPVAASFDTSRFLSDAKAAEYAYNQAAEQKVPIVLSNGQSSVWSINEMKREIDAVMSRFSSKAEFNNWLKQGGTAPESIRKMRNTVAEFEKSHNPNRTFGNAEGLVVR